MAEGLYPQTYKGLRKVQGPEARVTKSKEAAKRKRKHPGKGTGVREYVKMMGGMGKS